MLDHKGTKVIETPRLILRRFTMEDTPAMFLGWASDEEVCRYMTWPPHENVEVTRALLSRWTASYVGEDYYNWAIVLKGSEPELIGNISVNLIRENIGEATVGYCMSRAHWGKGIMTEALTALINFFFDEVGFNRIMADHDANNPASGRVMEKSGMRFEGTARQGGWNNQGIIDLCRWAILKSDR